MERVLEPEVMDTMEETIAYDAMDFSEINTSFAKEAIALCPLAEAMILDAGTGTARIPVLMCQMQPKYQIIAIDMAETMLQVAAKHIEETRLENQITLELVDAKHLRYANGQFDMVVSNSLVHHLPNPLPFFKELKRVLKPNGGIFIRDLFRPVDEEIINSLVDSIGTEYDEHQKKLFRDSLHAALTLEEVEELITQAGLEGVKVYQSSDRHWTAQRHYHD
ncbi:MAG: class I SAM-dependent methyltransferase [Nostocaceae cyanobacterium]|nr:class I SAM-dependent methyltransferase [Nostocaceae cyanobacterium]